MNSPNLTVRDGALGQGLHALRTFRPGERILMFEGPQLTHEEALAQADARGFALQVAPDRYIDPTPPGCYANHSCDPNAGIWQDRYLVAIRHIAEGEQIQFDYSTAIGRDHWTMQCRCGSAKCRGMIGDFHRLPVTLQVHYLRLGIVPQFIVRECQRRVRGETPIGRAPREPRSRRVV